MKLKGMAVQWVLSPHIKQGLDFMHVHMFPQTSPKTLLGRLELHDVSCDCVLCVGQSTDLGCFFLFDETDPL